VITLLHGADFHLGITRYGHPTARGTNSRLDDFAATLARFVDVGIDRKVDLLVLAGDTFDTRHERPEERQVLASALVRARAAGIPVVIVEGNHDGRRVVGDAESSSLRWLQTLTGSDEGLVVITKPGLVPVWAVRGKPIRIVGLPYPHKRSLDLVLADYAPGDRVVEAGRRLDYAIRSMAEEAHVDGIPTLFVGHLTVGGATTGTERVMRFEDDVAIGSDALDGFDYAALGHLHKQQRVSDKAAYAGAPEYIDFGEEGDPKGFLLVTMEAGEKPEVHGVASGVRVAKTVMAAEVRPHRTMIVSPEVLLSEEGGRKWVLTSGLDDLAGAMVRLRVMPHGPVRSEGIAFLQSKVREAGASFVKTEVVKAEVAPTERPEVDRDLDPMEATRRHLGAKKVPPDQIEAAMAVAGQLLAATQ